MKSNELRVGNWVYSNHDDETFKVRGFDIGALDDGMDCESMQPIPLTPQILGKSGFKLDAEFDAFESEKFDIWFYHIENKGFTYSNMVDGGKLIEYAHELQNLYFALTGEELNIQL